MYVGSHAWAYMCVCRKINMHSSGIQGIYALLVGGPLPWVYVHCLYIYRSAITCAKSGVAVCKASMLNWPEGPSAMGICTLSIYI